MEIKKCENDRATVGRVERQKSEASYCVARDVPFHKCSIVRKLETTLPSMHITASDRFDNRTSNLYIGKVGVYEAHHGQTMSCVVRAGVKITHLVQRSKSFTNMQEFQVRYAPQLRRSTPGLS